MSSFVEAVNTLIRNEISKLWTAIPCKVLRVNTAGNTISVDVVPMIEGIYESNHTEQLPTILNVPVLMPATEVAIINIPVKKDSCVLCVFSKLDMDNFLLGSTDIGIPASNRAMNYNDAIAIPGLYPFKEHPNKNRTLPHDADSLSLTNNIGTALENTVSLAADGSISMKSPTQIDLDAPVVTINGIVFGTHTHNVSSAPGVSATPNP